jgi:DNA processing protein
MDAMKPQTDEELGPWLALFCVPHLSLRLTHQLLEHFKTPQRILAADADILRNCFHIKPKALSALQSYLKDTQTSTIGKAITATLNWQHASPDHHIVHWAQPDYPVRLREIAQPPLILFVAGNPKLLNRPQLAFVGTRNPSFDGKQLAHEFARQLSLRGVLITSGLALGIDGASHEGALASCSPTIAVMATGMDRIYPARHRQLAQQIREHGALVSEFPLGHQPTPQSFPQRNRIISGLSLGVLVVEAAIRSGSLITARYALEQNREVFAIPGSIHNPVTKGCHQLIRQGAKLVESVEHIVEEIGHLIEPILIEPVLIEPLEKSSPEAPLLSEPLQALLAHMGYDPVSVDTLVERTGFDVIRLSGLLTELCLLKQVEQTEQGYVRLFNAP